MGLDTAIIFVALLIVAILVVQFLHKKGFFGNYKLPWEKYASFGRLPFGQWEGGTPDPIQAAPWDEMGFGPQREVVRFTRKGIGRFNPSQIDGVFHPSRTWQKQGLGYFGAVDYNRDRSFLLSEDLIFVDQDTGVVIVPNPIPLPPGGKPSEVLQVATNPTISIPVAGASTEQTATTLNAYLADNGVPEVNAFFFTDSYEEFLKSATQRVGQETTRQVNIESERKEYTALKEKLEKELADIDEKSKTTEGSALSELSRKRFELASVLDEVEIILSNLDKMAISSFKTQEELQKEMENILGAGLVTKENAVAAIAEGSEVAKKEAEVAKPTTAEDTAKTETAEPVADKSAPVEAQPTTTTSVGDEKHGGQGTDNLVPEIELSVRNGYKVPIPATEGMSSMADMLDEMPFMSWAKKGYRVPKEGMEMRDVLKKKSLVV